LHKTQAFFVLPMHYVFDSLVHFSS
jgi:hypothetical protein